MNCRDFARLVDSRTFGSLTESERNECESHAQSCRHCAAMWVGHARLAALRIPPMPTELATRCRTLVAARAQGSVLRFVPRGMMLMVGGFVVLAAAAGALTVHLVNAPAQRTDTANPSLQVQTPLPKVADPQLDQDINRVGTNPSHVDNGEADMKKTGTITAAVVALGAAAAAQAQTAPAADEPRHKSAQEIIDANDLNKDGIVTLAEAKKVNGNLYFMWSAVYDMDHDDRLDVAELSRAMTDVELGTSLDKITGDNGNHMAAARPSTIMTNNDLNKDGIVTKEEATKAGKALIRMWDSYDFNKDGKVDAAEVSRGQGY